MKIRSMYFRDDAEEQAVKAFIAKLRGKQPISTPQVTPQPAPQAPKTAFASYPVEVPKLPDFLTDIMNGGAFPAPEELTRAEQAILYDSQVNTLVNLYRQSKNNDLAQHIRERLDELGVDF